MTDLKLTVSKTVNAPIEKVFDAWLDPKTLSKIMLPMPGMPDSDVENDPREGGNFSIIMHGDDSDYPHNGVYLEIERPNKLVFTWQSDHSVDDSKVTITFSKIDEHKTTVSLTHIKFIDAQARDDHKGGWTNILNKLEEMLG